MRLLRFALPSVFLVALAVSACDSSKRPTVPKGIQELQGVVQPASLKVVRRGTHVLMQNGRETYFLESASVNLHDVEEHEVTLRGTFEANTDPTAEPVLIVQEIIKDELSVRAWSLPTLGISFDVPKNWDGSIVEDRALFTASGSSQVVLEVSATTLEAAPFQAFSDPNAEEEGRIMPVVIASKRALRVIDERTGSEQIFLDLGTTVSDPSKRVITFTFHPPITLDASQARETLLRLIKSISLGSKAKSSAASSRGGSLTGTGSTIQKEGAPCGGTAGVLCPSGYYCNVTDLQANVGRCKKL